MKSDILQLRLSPPQKEAIRQAANASHISMSEWILKKLFPPSSDAFWRLVRELEKHENTDKQSLALASLNDFLNGLASIDFPVAVQNIPPNHIGVYVANYLAAMLETAAHRLGVPPPSWVREIRALSTPVFGTQLESLRLYLLTNSPLAFRRRNIFIDATIGDRV